ncbi:HSP20-like chaperone [Wallemia mellicola]|uniref:HSP20-like chaperone n=2 Tax=Wallemia mellicola TaxID=1708541 RepID=A0A4T0SJ79_9BASI|nr:HSP20-like chaperone [Wallemia mellicola CBS 633.66]TIB72064.1 hypothetical protein E3Q23_03549 [Wallemia mellicola]EIM20687.1 HSP20-like chaperone [Wallemia mellicola CBS 633.66]TIB76172.1 HSP20-like chaperone [Wallemia mellicola]TIB87869.1 HSP20-like chaperone [Wallemia mellicola]TIB95533.1 HSP20-like chaperone [Wallemia mellicola]|eukprot:XP_006959220.1 HSP20-like chaperone [Wallemia mellicola CBS 633.66]
MSIIRNDPFFAELSDFDSFFTPIIRRPHSNKEGGNVLRGQSSLFRPSLDVQEVDNGYLAQLNLPGLKKEDVDISLDKGLLNVKASQKQETVQDDRNWHIRERHFGEFSRSWAVPPELTHEDIKASLNDGVLTLNYPKKDAEGAKKITIS